MKPARHLKRIVSESSRRRKIDQFYQLASGTVLDVGVSSRTHHDRDPWSNFFLRNYRFPPETYTGLGVEDLSGMSELYPDYKFVRYAGDIMPFRDDEFDWVFSNAVIEHVNDHELFLKEMLRVGKQVFFTTPNRYFPIEVHTNLLFTHWHDERFQKWLMAHRPEADPINLLCDRTLEGLLDKVGARAEIYRNRLFGWTMTFTVVARAQAAERGAASSAAA